jgi:DNA invertase Pin-like site-specific DNA recombinase
MQKENDSPQQREERAPAYCKIKGREIKEVYSLLRISGKLVADHPQCQRMLQDIHNKHIEALVFSKHYRFARSVKELLYFGAL